MINQDIKFIHLACYGVGVNNQVTGTANFEVDGAKNAIEVQKFLSAAPDMFRELQNIYDFMIDRGEDEESEGMMDAKAALDKARGIES